MSSSTPSARTGGRRKVTSLLLPRAIILQPNDGCLTLARALHRRDIEVHVLTSPEYSYVVASRGVHGTTLPDPLDDPVNLTSEPVHQP